MSCFQPKSSGEPQLRPRPLFSPSEQKTFHRFQKITEIFHFTSNRENTLTMKLSLRRKHAQYAQQRCVRVRERERGGVMAPALTSAVLRSHTWTRCSVRSPVRHCRTRTQQVVCAESSNFYSERIPFRVDVRPQREDSAHLTVSHLRLCSARFPRLKSRCKEA